MLRTITYESYLTVRKNTYKRRSHDYCLLLVFFRATGNVRFRPIADIDGKTVPLNLLEFTNVRNAIQGTGQFLCRNGVTKKR